MKIAENINLRETSFGKYTSLNETILQEVFITQFFYQDTLY